MWTTQLSSPRCKYPSFCLTESADPKQVRAIVRQLRGNSAEARMARAAAEIEGLYYCKLTRVEEIVLFAKRIGADRVGIASCLGLIEESRIFSKIVRAKGLDPYTVVCKVGSVDKTEIGSPRMSKCVQAPARRCVIRSCRPACSMGRRPS